MEPSHPKARPAHWGKGRGPQPLGRVLSGAWRLLAALVLLGLVSLLLIAPMATEHHLYEQIALLNSPHWLMREFKFGYPAAGKAYGGAEVVPLEIRLVERALREMGAREFTMVGKMARHVTLYQRGGEFIYPIVMRKSGAPYLVGERKDLEARGAKVVWEKRGVAIGVVDK